MENWMKGKVTKIGATIYVRIPAEFARMMTITEDAPDIDITFDGKRMCVEKWNKK